MGWRKYFLNFILNSIGAQAGKTWLPMPFPGNRRTLSPCAKKIQASREGRVINPAAIAKTPATPAVTYPDDVAATYPNKAANLLELENQRGVRLLYPEIFKRLGGITREAVDRPIYPGVNGEP